MANRTISRWHEIVADADLVALADILHDDVVFHSPVVHSPQVGKSLTLMYLSGALHVLRSDSFKYVREIVGESNAVLEFNTEIEGIVINGVDLIEWNYAGKIVDFKVMIRPLKAINLVHQKMGELLKKDQKSTV